MYGSGLLKWYINTSRLSPEYSSTILETAGSAFAHGPHQVPVKTSITTVLAEVFAWGVGPGFCHARLGPLCPAVGKAITSEPTITIVANNTTETAIPARMRMVSPPSGIQSYGPSFRRVRQR